MLKIFLVEDESIMREGLRDNMPWQQFGYEFVGEASDGEMALPLIRKTRPDVLLTDIKMPFMDGLTLCGKLKENYKNTKVVLYSGFDDFELQRIHEHTLMNDGCKIIDIYRNSRSHSVVELKIEKENGNKDAFCLIL